MKNSELQLLRAKSELMAMPINQSRWLRLSGQSMSPFVEANEFMHVEFYERPGEGPHAPGDLVLIRSEAEWVVHRLLKTREGLRTKGDHSQNYDTPSVIWGRVSANARCAWGKSLPPRAGIFQLASKLYHFRTPRVLRWAARALMFAATPVRTSRGAHHEAWSVLSGETKWSEVAHPAAVLKLLDAHKLLGFLYSTQRKYLDAPLERQLQVDWKNQWARNELNLLLLKDVENRATALGLTVTRLKGMALTDRIYSNRGARFMSDADVLVHPDEHAEFCKMLEGLGWRPLPTPRWRANAFKREFHKTQSGAECALEVHTELIPFRPLLARHAFKEIRKTGGMSLEIELLYLAAHAGYQHTFLRIYWLLDIGLFIRHHAGEINWSRVFKLADELRLSRSLKMGLSILQKNFTLTEAPQISNFIQRSPRISWSEKALWQPDQYRWGYFLNKFRLREGVRDVLQWGMRLRVIDPQSISLKNDGEVSNARK